VVAAIRGAPRWALVGPTTIVAVATIQLIAAVLVVLGPLPLIGQLALITATVTPIALRGRRILGGDGAERLTTIIVIAASLAFIPITSPDRATLAVAFLAGLSRVARW
jgi:hypothetical protein